MAAKAPDQKTPTAATAAATATSPTAGAAAAAAASGSAAGAAGAGAAPAAATKAADIKIILLGDSMVGKSKLVERFLMDNYVPQQLSTEALTVFRHTAKRADKTHEIEFWDTAGQERFQSMHPSYYHRAHSCILVFDVTRKQTYTHLSDWYKELQNYRKGIPIIVVANKIDVDYKVMSKSFAWAAKRSLPLVFCSAADGTNVVKLFDDAVDAAVAYQRNPPPDFIEDVLRVDDYFQAKEQAAKAAAAQAAADAQAQAQAASAAAAKAAAEKAAADKLRADFERANKLQADLAARAAAGATATGGTAKKPGK